MSKKSRPEALPDFIEGNIDVLVAEWESFARTRLPAAGVMDGKALRNGAAAILRAVAADARSAQSADQQREKSRGGRPENAPAVNETAKEHARDRLGSGFTLDQLVSEYRALRASVVRRWSDLLPAPDAQVNELIRFDEAMDQSLSEAIRWFNGGLEEARSLFVGMLGHDLRDPLNAILAAAQLQERTGDVAVQRTAAEKILRSGHRMRAMIDDLLDFARTRLGERLPIEPVPSDLSELCRQIADEAQLWNGGGKVALHCTGDLAAECDPDRLKQMVSNLLSNALRHGRKHSLVTIDVRGAASEITISVHNEGKPIPADQQHRIFNPLTRNDKEADGLGLGLYVVNEIAIAHGGRVSVTSSAETGTTFTVHLPRRASAPEEAQIPVERKAITSDPWASVPRNES